MSNQTELDVWHDHAMRAYVGNGQDYIKARRELARQRDNNAPGTASFSFGNAAVKALEQMKRNGEIE